MTGVIDGLWGTMRARGTSSSLLMLFRLLRTRFSQLACMREQKTQRNVWLRIISMQSWGKTTTVKLKERAESPMGSGGRCDGDQSRQTDLSFAHVGQRLFEMLGRSRRMARGQLTGINKQKRKECYRTMEDRKDLRKDAAGFQDVTWAVTQFKMSQIQQSV